MTFPVTDANSATQQLLTGAELQAAFATVVTALNATLAGTQPISATSLPLPTGAATAAGNAAILAALGTPALPAGAATATGVAAVATAIGLTTAAMNFVAVTPSDTVVVPNAATIKSLYVTVAGNLAVKSATGTAITIPVVVGQVLPLAPAYVMATNTTATVIALL